MAFAEYGIFCDAFDDLGDVVAEYLADGIFRPHKFHTAFLLSMIRNYFSVILMYLADLMWTRF